jgi:hypothetical protein
MKRGYIRSITLDSAELYHSSGGFDANLLLLKAGLMILGQRHGGDRTSSVQHCS